MSEPTKTQFAFIERISRFTGIEFKGSTKRAASAFIAAFVRAFKGSKLFRKDLGSERGSMECWRAGIDPIPDWIASASASHRDPVIWHVLTRDGNRFDIQEGDCLAEANGCYQVRADSFFDKMHEEAR